MTVPRRLGPDRGRDTTRRAQPNKETKRRTYNDAKLDDPEIKNKYLEALKDSCQVAEKTIADLRIPSVTDQTQKQHRVNLAFAAVKKSIDTAATCTLGISMKSVTHAPPKKKGATYTVSPPHITKMIQDRATLRTELAKLRAIPYDSTTDAHKKLLQIHKKNAEIRESSQQNRIQNMIDSLLQTPNNGISLNQHTYAPKNSSTWQKIKQVHRITESFSQLPDFIYTNAGAIGNCAWNRGPLASNAIEAGKAWNEF